MASTLTGQSPAELTDSAVATIVQTYLDEMAKERAESPTALPSWTTKIGGKTVGLDQKWIYLGPLKIPTALLALLPIKVQGNMSNYQFNQQLQQMRVDLFEAARRSENYDEFKEAVKDLRQQKEREREFKKNQRTRPIRARTDEADRQCRNGRLVISADAGPTSDDRYRGPPAEGRGRRPRRRSSVPARRHRQRHRVVRHADSFMRARRSPSAVRASTVWRAGSVASCPQCGPTMTASVIQAEFGDGPKRAALWGTDAAATGAAVDAFIARGWLDEFLDRCWRFRAGAFA